MASQCGGIGCTKRPYYNLPGETRGLYCVAHKSPEMINVVGRHCEEPGCTKSPSYNIAGEARGVRCAAHKSPEMVNVVSRRCAAPGCTRQPSYNEPGKTRGVYCAIHKLPSMVDVKHRHCAEPGCATLPCYNRPGEARGIYCSAHRLPEMVDVRNLRCAEPGCSKMSTFNLLGETRGIRCAAHKLANMVDVKSRHCEVPGCLIIPIFNLPGETRGSRCSSHKLAGMIDVKNRRCATSGCTRQPSYNLLGEIRGLYCLAHKLPEMVDVTSRRCSAPECSLRASYGYPGYSPTRCQSHGAVGMITTPNRRCKEEKCKAPAVYGNRTPSHCTEHRSPDECCLLTGHCQKCGLPELRLDGSGLCELCGKLGPAYHKARMIKQERLRTTIEAAGYRLYSYDKVLDKGVCTRRRPDYVIDAGTHFVVIERDEHQHKRSDYAGCEANRMREIAIALGLPTIFIRYNPDAYKTANGQNGRAVEATREKTLLIWLRQAVSTPPEPTTQYIRVLYLYYDGWLSEEAKLEDLPLEEARAGSDLTSTTVSQSVDPEESAAMEKYVLDLLAELSISE